MNEGARRGVTRGYVGGLTAATLITALALIVASWGMLSLVSGRAPIEGVAPRWVAPLILGVNLGVFAWGLWQQALILLKGRKTPTWAITISLAGGAYLIWCLGGVLAGLTVSDTWTSWFAALLAPIWGLCSLLFWVVLARRVYTDRPPPRWPWERKEDPR